MIKIAGDVVLRPVLPVRRRMMNAMKAKINVDLLKQCRNDAGYSISDIAEYLGCYKTPTGYWLIEKNQRKASVEVLYKLAKLYDMRMEEFIVEIEESQ